MNGQHSRRTEEEQLFGSIAVHGRRLLFLLLVIFIVVAGITVVVIVGT